MEIPLPEVAPGQVLWIQPVLTNVAGVTHWAPARVFKDFEYPPLERKPALLQLKYDSPGERTVKWGTAFGVQYTRANHSTLMSLEAEAVETVRKEPKGGQLHLCLSKGKDEIIGLNKEQRLQTAQALDLLRGRYFSYATNPEGAILVRANPNFEANKPMNLRREFEGHANLISNTFELTCLPMPNPGWSNPRIPGRPWSP